MNIEYHANMLGDFLATSRKKWGFSQRQVARHLARRKEYNHRFPGCTAAYLGQLEAGKVQQPNPNILYELARIYGVNYNHLMQYAGYPVLDGDKAASCAGEWERSVRKWLQTLEGKNRNGDTRQNSAGRKDTA